MPELKRLERVLNLVTSVMVADGEVRPEELELFELMVENLGLEERVIHRYRVMRRLARSTSES